MDNNTDNEMTLQRELQKAQAEIAELRAQLDAQRNAFDFNRAFERIKAREADNEKYREELQQRFAGNDTISTTDFI